MHIFVYCKLQYTLHREAAEGEPLFKPVAYPNMLDGPACLAPSWLSAEAASTHRQIFGSNRYLIDVPTPRQLLVQQMVAPMFVFQISTMRLYMLDGMVIFCLLMIGMPVFIEFMLANELPTLSTL